MEVVAAVASVAGIVSLVGQSLQALGALAQFVRGARQAPVDLVDLLCDIKDLYRILENIKYLEPTLQEALDVRQNPKAKVPILSLHRAVWICHNNLTTSNDKLCQNAPKSRTVISSLMHKLKFAALGKEEIAKLRENVESDKQTLTLIMTMLTSFLAQHGAKTTNQIQHRVTSLTKSNLKLSNTLIEVSHQAAAQGENLWNLASEGFMAVEASIQRSAENHDKASSFRHKVAQSNISSIGESIATLATSVSKIAEKLEKIESHCSEQGIKISRIKKRSNTTAPGSLHDDRLSISSRNASAFQARPARRRHSTCESIAPATPASMQDLSRTQSRKTTMYCCDTVSGIDDAFRLLRSTDSSRTMQCIYCWDLFEDSSSRTLGRHLVDAHAFGQCNLREAYRSWKRFRSHLQKFHGANYSDHELPITRKKFIPQHVYRYQEAAETKDRYPTMPPIERSTEDMCIVTKLAMLLAQTGLYKSNVTAFQPRDRLDLAHSLRRLEERAFGGQASEGLIPLLCQAACLEEELIIQCDQPLPYNWSVFSLYELFASGTLDLGLAPPTSWLTRHWQSRWLCIEPRNRDGMTTALSNCAYCLNGTIYNSKASALRHLKFKHPEAVGDAGLGSWIDKYPRPLDYRDVWPMVDHADSETSPEMLDAWMIGVFFESDYLRAILRSGVIFDVRPFLPPESSSFNQPIKFTFPAQAPNVEWTMCVNETFQSVAEIVSYPEYSCDRHGSLRSGASSGYLDVMNALSWT